MTATWVEALEVSLQRFGEPALLQALQKLSTDRLTIVVGAGASVESGLPTWGDLVSTLLRTVAHEQGLSSGDAELFATWTQQREGLTAAGEMARNLLKDFRTALRGGLYGLTSRPLPGETARAIATLCVDQPDSPPEVVTTNYDTMLEDALRHEAKKRGVTDLVLDRRADSREVKPGHVGVRHLHGVLTPGNQLIGKLVMSDSDYYSMQDANAWQESFFEGILQESTCLFVGTSLTDPNLLRYLYRTESERRHFAVFTRQAEAELYDSDQPSVMLLREESQFAKWRALGIEPILLDHYSESAQFIWELLAARRLGDTYVTLPSRLGSWWRDMERILPTSNRSFVVVQERLQQIMANALASTKSLINSEGFRVRPGERLGISMWVYDPIKEALINWASADRLWRDSVTLEPTRIHWSSSFVAALAFCAGSMVSQSTSQHVVSRWNHVIGFPVYVHNIAGRLPVGVVTLASTEDKSASILHRAEDVVRGSAIPQLEIEVESLLAPLSDPIAPDAESNSVTAIV